MNSLNYDPPHSLSSSETSKDSPQPVAQSEAHSPQATASQGYEFWPLYLFLAFILGLGTGYMVWGRSASNRDNSTTIKASAISAPTPSVTQVTLPDSYTLPISFSDVGPHLLAAGAIDYDQFVQVYQEAGQPLTADQLAILTQGSNEPIVINKENAYFLLNFFWALGLTNQNRLLTEGPMMQYNKGDIGGFASTGGWTIGAKPATALYASTPLIELNLEQQARLEEVAQAVYRPCCDNPTTFPDCNHGMAMLGLLELMASQDATVEEMFTAAKYINSFWFPQQTLELALLFKLNKNQDFADVDARELVGPNLSSGTGFQAVHQWAVANKLLDQLPGNGNSCGV